MARGLKVHKAFKTKYHGKVRVQDSSAASAVCGWIYAELAYSNTPHENPPHLHLTLSDCIKLRDGLNKFIAAWS